MTDVRAPELLCVHQGCELYGSDRSFLLNLRLLAEALPPQNILVILPKHGPLVPAIESLGVRIEFDDLWIPRKAAGMLRLVLSLARLPKAIWSAARRQSKADHIYINTSIVFDHMMAFGLSWRRGSAKTGIIHIREIPTGRAFHLINAVLGFSRLTPVFNSRATAEAFGYNDRWIDNAIIDPASSGLAPSATRKDLQPLRILMIGRINAWKGQDLLLDAMALLPEPERKRFHLTFAGDAFENSPHRTEIETKLAAIPGLSVEMPGFLADPSAAYQAADVVVVPSKKPEPFGLVAVEAMAFGKPVLAADHGGLAEIVEAGVTGWKFTPNDAGSLSEHLAALHTADLTQVGQAARARFEQKYSEEAYRERAKPLLTDLTKGPGRGIQNVGSEANP